MNIPVLPCLQHRYVVLRTEHRPNGALMASFRCVVCDAFLVAAIDESKAISEAREED